MSDFPIIFSAPMVRALLDDRKTMTRRLAWSHPGKAGRRAKRRDGWPEGMWPSQWQNRIPGDRLWVREKLHIRPVMTAAHAVSYFDEEDQKMLGGWKYLRLLSCHGAIKRPEKPIWRPASQMPRELSRLTLFVTATKIERLQAITSDDAKLEGAESRPNCSGYNDGREGWSMDWSRVGTKGTGGMILRERDLCLATPRAAFGNYWCRLHGPDSWNANPEVVALTFKVIKANIDAPEARAA
jgi:hypothetical protein